jgi:hypothetical protein
MVIATQQMSLSKSDGKNWHNDDCGKLMGNQGNAN